MKFIKWFSRVCFHPNEIARLCITTGYCGLGILANFYALQALCIPVWPATLVSGLFLAAILAVAFIPQPAIRKFVYLLLGTGIPVCIYLILFLSDPWSLISNYIYYALGILWLGLGLLAFIPLYLLWHVYRYYQSGTSSEKRYLLVGAAIITLLLGTEVFRYYQTAGRITHALSGNRLSKMPNNRYKERLLGIGFKYHTKIEYIYDGWRPPLHDPALNIYLWCFSNTYHPSVASGFDAQIRLYHQYFPEEPVRVRCACSEIENAQRYHLPWDTVVAQH
jgi:hypothetical protein